MNSNNMKHHPSNKALISLGIIIVIISVVISFIIWWSSIEVGRLVQNALLVSLFVIKIAVTIRVVKIASHQNRSKLDWGWLAFFFPGIALILIGQSRKTKG
ncbi:MAG: hypothetical protein FWG79_01005 [Bacteroidales bacterium]|nr:hypothetical protein [Bacteroidales bacterium]